MNRPSERHAAPLQASHPHHEPLEERRGLRAALALGIPMLLALVGYGPLLAYRSDLPDRVASHYDASGTPDGSMTLGSFVGVTSVLIAVGVICCVATALHRPARGALSAIGAFVGGLVGALGAGILATTVITHRDLTDWRAAEGGVASVLITIVAALAVGALAAGLAARITPDDRVHVDRSATPTIQLGADEQAVWSTTLHSRPLLMLAATIAVVGVVIAVGVDLVIGVILLAASLPAAALATIRVRVDRTGLRVHFGPLPRPSMHVSVADIAEATVIDVRPKEWGGWGYRGSLKLMQRAAVVLRAGPGIRVDLVDGKVFAVTADDAKTGAALLNAQVRRHHDSGSLADH